MSLSQVESILGKGESTASASVNLGLYSGNIQSEVINWQSGTKLISITFTNGKVIIKAQKGLTSKSIGSSTLAQEKKERYRLFNLKREEKGEWDRNKTYEQNDLVWRTIGNLNRDTFRAITDISKAVNTLPIYPENTPAKWEKIRWNEAAKSYKKLLPASQTITIDLGNGKKETIQVQ